jgi:hypothetical protein
MIQFPHGIQKRGVITQTHNVDTQIAIHFRRMFIVDKVATMSECRSG